MLTLQKNKKRKNINDLYPFKGNKVCIKSPMKKTTKIITLLITAISIGFIIYFAILCFKYNYLIENNYLIMLSSLWGFCATFFIGVIAFWQNKKYKQLSDEINDLALKPEIGLLDEKDTKDIEEDGFFGYKNQISGNITTKGIYDFLYGQILLPVIMSNLPIQNIEIQSVSLDNKVLAVTGTNCQSFYIPYTKFYISLFIDPDTPPGSVFTITLSYQNSCNWQYQKDIKLTWLGNGVADNIIFKPAIKKR